QYKKKHLGNHHPSFSMFGFCFELSSGGQVLTTLLFYGSFSTEEKNEVQKFQVLIVIRVSGLRGKSAKNSIDLNTRKQRILVGFALSTWTPHFLSMYLLFRVPNPSEQQDTGTNDEFRAQTAVLRGSLPVHRNDAGVWGIGTLQVDTRAWVVSETYEADLKQELTLPSWVMSE
ncbi:hypothetical protein K435DRAFT_811284, partial [Dendrothele bispora CBS 962.96]